MLLVIDNSFSMTDKQSELGRRIPQLIKTLTSTDPDPLTGKPKFRPARFASVIVEELAQQIVSGALAEGDVLPTEPALCEQFGCSWDYTREKIGMTFVLEAHVTYDREVKQDDHLRITIQILDHDAKRIHYMHLMYHGSEGYLAATNELMLMNIDYETRKSAPWPDCTTGRTLSS